MATTRLRFALPYEPETQLGRAIGAVSNAMFGGPTAYQIEAQQAERDAHQATAALKQNELQGRGALADRIAQWTTAMSDPTQREAMFKTYAPGLAETAARYGYDPGKAVELFRFSMATPTATEQNRAFGTYATKGEIGNYSSFGDLGAQRAAEQRDEAAKTRIQSASAAAANPDKYYRVSLQKKIVGTDETGIDARRIAGVESAPTTEMQNRREISRATGVNEVDLIRYEKAQARLKHYALPFGGFNIPLFEKENPDDARAIREVSPLIMRAQSGPRMHGQRPTPDGQGWTIPSPVNGAPVPVRREADGKWYFRDVDGKVKRIDQPDY